MNFGDFAQAGFEVLPRLVLHSSILDETGEMVFALPISNPPEFVDITVELEFPGRLEFEALSSLYFFLENIEAHSVDGVFEASVLQITLNIEV
jgi:hypothetical protein